MHDVAGLGSRLREARREAGLSADWMVRFLNGYLVSAGMKPVGIQTYYSWERIGTPRERPGKSYPHPLIYKLVLIPLGVTGYWLFNGDMGGKIVKYRKDLPQLEKINYGIEQKSGVTLPDRLRIEFNRVEPLLSNGQKRGLLELLKAIR